MPKLKETVQRDRFRIIAELDKELVGDVLGMFARMGVNDVSYELITDIRTHHRNPTRDSASVLSGFLSELGSRRTFSTKEAVEYFKAAGVTPAAAYFALKKMVDTNQLTKFEDKTYGIAPKQLPAPERMNGAEVNGAKVAALDNVTNKQAIIAFIANRGKGQTFTTSELREAFKQQNRNVDQISSRLNELAKAKRVKQSGERGSYIVL